MCYIFNFFLFRTLMSRNLWLLFLYIKNYKNLMHLCSVWKSLQKNKNIQLQLFVFVTINILFNSFSSSKFFFFNWANIRLNKKYSIRKLTWKQNEFWMHQIYLLRIDFFSLALKTFYWINDNSFYFFNRYDTITSNRMQSFSSFPNNQSNNRRE